MYHLPKRGTAIIATVTTLAAGSAIYAIPAGAVDQTRTVTTSSLLGGGLTGDLLGLLGNVLTMTTAELQAALAPLTPEEVGDLLAAADPAQLTKLLSALDPEQLSGALGTLSPAELDAVVDGIGVAQLGDLLTVADPTQLTALLDALDSAQLTDALATLDPTELTSVVAVLSPDQITSLLGSPSGVGSVLTGLSGVASGMLDGGTPSAAGVDVLLGQVQALLAADFPLLSDQLLTLNSLLTSVGSLVDVAGVDTALLTALLGTVTDQLAAAPVGADTSVLEDLIGAITDVLDPVGVIPPAPTPPGTILPGTTPPGTTAPPGAPKPGTPAGSIFDLVPTTGKTTAKLGLARATIVRSNRQLDVLATITARSSGRVNVDLHAAGRHHRFTAPVDSANGRIRFKQSIPNTQARLGTGIMTIDYAGNDVTRPQSVRLRAASQPARLSLGRPTLGNDGRLKASGTVSRKARGVVRMEVQYLFLGETRTLKFRARIADGRWKLDEKLNDTALKEIVFRTGSVHSYTLFTGYFPERMRGEMRSYQILGDPPR